MSFASSGGSEQAPTTPPQSPLTRLIATSGVPASGVPEDSVGIILQRGGDELILERTPDRFTAMPTPGALPDWVTEIPAEPNQRLPRTDFVEFIVDPQERDRAMERARENPNVAFVSHVYTVKEAPLTRVYLTAQISIQFAQDTPLQRINAIALAAGLTQSQPIAGVPNAFVFIVTKAALENPIKITNRLTALPEVQIAEPNIIIEAQALYRPRDPLYPQQWYLNHNGGNQLTAGSHVDVERAWDTTRGNRGIVIAVADDGMDLNHPDLQGAGKIVAPRDFKDRDFIPQPVSSEESHGTACAGVCVAEENGSGIVGVAPGCALMPIRTTGFLDDDSVEQLFNWASSQGAAVISCSWAPAAVNFPLSMRQSAAIARAARDGRQGRGCVIIFASGNANRPINGTINESGWPNNAVSGSTRWLAGFAVHPDVIAVSACTSLAKKSAYSNWGGQISVCAPSNNAPPGVWLPETGYILTPPQVRTSLPGLGILTSDRTGSAGYSSGDFTGDFGGTSSATPVVAGVAALVLSVNPYLTAVEVRRILQDTADKIVDLDPDPQFGFRKGTYSSAGHSEWFGYGKVNAFRAVQAAKARLTTPSPSRQVTGVNSTPVAIPDHNAQGVTSAIALADSSALRDIRVTVDVEHSFLGDLEISLIAPNNRTILLQSRTLGRRTRLQTQYTFQSTPTLQQLLGISARGTWRLLLVDRAPGETGRLNSWQLSVGV